MVARVLLFEDDEKQIQEFKTRLGAEEQNEQEFELCIVKEAEQLFQCIAQQDASQEAFSIVFMLGSLENVKLANELWEKDQKLYVAFFETPGFEQHISVLARQNAYLLVQSTLSSLELKQICRLTSDARSAACRHKSTIQALSDSNTDLLLVDHVKTQILLNMNHELRTPLTAISGFSQILEMSVEDEADLEAVTFIRTNVDRLREYVENILEITAMTSGTLKPKASAFPTAELFVNLDTQFSPIAQERKLSLKLEVDEKLPDILDTDCAMARQIVDNLVDNALKYTEEGGVQVNFIKREIEGEDFIEVSVCDTGVGIPDSMLDRVFEAFEEADGEITATSAADDLGLATVKRLCNALAGDVSVGNNPDGGCTFTAYFAVCLNTEDVAVDA